MSHWTQMFSASKQVFGVCFYNYLGTPHKLCYLKTPMSPSDDQGFCHSTLTTYFFYAVLYCWFYFVVCRSCDFILQGIFFFIFFNRIYIYIYIYIYIIWMSLGDCISLYFLWLYSPMSMLDSTTLTLKL